MLRKEILEQDKETMELEYKLICDFIRLRHELGLTQQQKSDWAYIIGRESGFKTSATNGSHWGIGQLTAGNIETYASDPTAYYNGDSNVQINSTYNYILDRYGSIENARAFWDSHGWY